MYRTVLTNAFIDELEKIANASRSKAPKLGIPVPKMQNQMMRTPKVPLQTQLPSQQPSANIPQPAPPPQTSSLPTSPLVGM